MTVKQLLADAAGKDRDAIEQMIADEEAGPNRTTAIEGLRALITEGESDGSGKTVAEPSPNRTWRNSRDGRVRTFARGSYADRRYASFPVWVEVD